MFGRRFESAHLHKRGSQLAESLFCGDAHRCKAAVSYLCLGALPLLYPAAPPSVFDYFIVKYTAPAVALVREHIQNNQSVREMLGKRGIRPEELPPTEDIKKLERRVASEDKRIEKSSPKLPKKK